MAKCSNCGQKTEGDFCQWCGYPVMKGGQGDKVKPKGKPEGVKSVKRAEARAKKVAEREAKERAKREAEGARKAKRPEAKANRVPEKETEVETGEAVGDGFYQGVVKLILVLPIALSQMRKLEEALHQVEGLHLEVIGGSVEGGSGIIISAENPIPLIDILKGMPSVAEAVKQGQDIRVVLKTE